MKNKTIQVLFVEPNKHPSIVNIHPTIKSFKKVLKASKITDLKTKKLSKNVYVIYRDNTWIDDAKANRKIKKEIVFDDFYVVGVEGKNKTITSLLECDLQKYINLFWKPETFTDEEILLNNLDMVLENLKTLKI